MDAPIPQYDLRSLLNLSEFARQGLRDGSMTKASLQCFYAAAHQVRNNKSTSHVGTLFKTYIEQHKNGDISLIELFEHTKVLMRYADAIQNNVFQRGTFIQEDWSPAEHGWHTALSLMFSVAHSPAAPVTGPDRYIMAEVMNTPQKLEFHLLRMFEFYCNARNAPRREGTNRITCSGEDDLLLGMEQGELRFRCRRPRSERMMNITLTPHAKRNSAAHVRYRVSVAWHTGSTDPAKSLGIEELLAKSQPVGLIMLDLPLRTTQSKELQKELFA